MTNRLMKSLVAVLSLTVILAACSSTPSAAPATSAQPTASPSVSAATAQGKVFTVDELAKFDGKNGSPAYIAVDGVVYDVSAVPEWKGGTHQGRFQAGRDLTVEIKTVSPHGTSKLQGLPVMGTLAK